MVDKEEARWQPTEGFPAVAAFIARDPDNETFVFRRFKRLSARVLLHLQSELAELEHQLDEIDEEAAKSHDLDLQLLQRDWGLFQPVAGTQSAGVQRMKQLMRDVKDKLREYHEMLALEGEIVAMEEPSARVTNAFAKDLKGSTKKEEAREEEKEREECQPKLEGRSAEILDSRADLLALRQPRDRDLLSTFLLNHWIFPTRDLRESSLGKEPAASVAYFEEKTLLRLVNVVSTVVAGLLLIGSILALYFVIEPKKRLGLVVVFIVLFAVGLGATTSASRDVMFAATAAYTSVLVVFVSGNLGASSAG